MNDNDICARVSENEGDVVCTFCLPNSKAYATLSVDKDGILTTLLTDGAGRIEARDIRGGAAALALGAWFLEMRALLAERNEPAPTSTVALGDKLKRLAQENGVDDFIEKARKIIPPNLLPSFGPHLTEWWLEWRTEKKR